jgi:hypothetical protein
MAQLVDPFAVGTRPLIPAQGGRRFRLLRHLRSFTVHHLNGQLQGDTCVRIDIQLFHKSPGKRAKDEDDVERCLPLLGVEDKLALVEMISIKLPEAHRWLPRLTG